MEITGIINIGGHEFCYNSAFPLSVTNAAGIDISRDEMTRTIRTANARMQTITDRGVVKFSNYFTYAGKIDEEAQGRHAPISKTHYINVSQSDSALDLLPRYLIAQEIVSDPRMTYRTIAKQLVETAKEARND